MRLGTGSANIQQCSFLLSFFIVVGGKGAFWEAGVRFMGIF